MPGKSAQQKECRPIYCIARMEEWVLLCYAFFLPISLTITWVFFIIGLVLWLLQAVLGEYKNKAKAPALLVPMMLLALAVTISGAVGGADATSSSASSPLAQAWQNLYSLKNIFPYFWASRVFMRNRALAKSCVGLLLCVSSIAGLYAAFQQVFDFHPGKFKYLQGTGFMGHPMAFAGQMQIFSMMALGLFISGGYRRIGYLSDIRQLAPLMRLLQKTPVFVAIVLCNLIGLFFAGERSAWIGGFTGVLSACALASWQLVVPALLLMMSAGAAAWFTVPLLRTRVEALFSGHDVSVSARLRIWNECLHTYFPRSPILGVGWLKFPRFDIREAIVPGVSRDLNHGHSNYIHILTTTGIVGICAYINLLIWSATACLLKVRSARKEKNAFETGLAIGLFSMNIALASSGVFEFNFGTAQVRLAEWFFFALL